MVAVANSIASLVYPSRNLLGEGPVWHAGRKSFFWVDIEGKTVSEMKWPMREVKSWPMPQRVGMIVPCEEDRLLIALQDGLAKLDLQNGELAWFLDVEKQVKDNRPNDGKCDSQGRLWLGTMNVKANANAGSLYCIDQNRKVTRQLNSLTIANGMAWSQNEECFYFIDSPLCRIDEYRLDPITARLKFVRTAVQTPKSLGMPDGMTIDEEGMLWVAQWDGFAVCRWNPHTGKMIHKINVPVPQVTSCTFGGKNLDVLFITTARKEMTNEALLKYPDSGHIFIAQPGVNGLLPNKFKYSNH